MPFDGLFNTSKPKELITLDSFRGEDKPFLIACFGGGRDSAAGMVLFAQLGIVPDLILMSDTKAERDATYNYLPIMNEYLRSVGFPEITMVNAGRSRDNGIEAHLLRLGVFASLSYGRHSCSVIWKIEAQNRFIESNVAVHAARRQGRKIVRAVFFEAGEEYRARRADKNAIGETTDADGCKRTTAFAVSPDDDGFVIYPLIEAGIDFDGVLDLIFRQGLPIPKKSSCTICAAMTEIEIYELSQEEPHKFFRALVLERVVQRNEVVIAGRVQGISFGVSWAKYECADPYFDRIDEVIELFGLDRAVQDGNPNPKSEAWRPKAARVELFLECFSTAENLRRFMNNELDMNFYAEKIQEINLMPTGAQMALPL
jgi:hypothetical protein